MNELEGQEILYGLDKNRLRLIRRWNVDSLVGKLLTMTDFAFSDPTQRKAFKDMLKQTTYNWFLDSNFVAGWDEWELDKAITELIRTFSGSNYGDGYIGPEVPKEEKVK